MNKKACNDEILVLFKDGVSQNRREEIATQNGTKVVNIIGSPPAEYYLLEIIDGVSVDEKIRRLKKYSEIRGVWPNATVSPNPP